MPLGPTPSGMRGAPVVVLAVWESPANPRNAFSLGGGVGRKRVEPDRWLGARPDGPRARARWSLALAAVLLQTGWLALPLDGLHGIAPWTATWGQIQGSVSVTWPCLAAPAVGAAWLPTARGLEGPRHRPWRSLVLVNALNVADALFT